MVYTEFKRHLGKAGLTVNEFAAFLGIKPSSVSNHARKADVPRTYAIMAVLMGQVVDQGQSIRELLPKYGIVPQYGSGNVHSLEGRLRPVPRPERDS